MDCFVAVAARNDLLFIKGRWYCRRDRDAVDRRLAEEARTGRGQLIDFEPGVGGIGSER